MTDIIRLTDTLVAIGFTQLKEKPTRFKDREFYIDRVHMGRYLMTVGGTTCDSIWLFGSDGRYIQNAKGEDK